jgi:hypothetical protein
MEAVEEKTTVARNLLTFWAGTDWETEEIVELARRPEQRTSLTS